MQRVTLDDIQRDFLKYLNQVETGESFLIVQADKPIAELKPITNTNAYLVYLLENSYCLIILMHLCLKRF